MGLEIELKYAATPAELAAIQAEYPGGYIEIPMTTSYYDTADGALSRRRWTLRHRREGADQVCTLKTPAAGDIRNEWECHCDSIGQALPVLARESDLEALSKLTEADLILSCGASFTRFAKTMDLGDAVVELALDQGILRNGSKELAFSELEVELKSGSEDAVRHFAADLARRHNLQIQPKSKFARAKALGQEG